MMTPKRGISSLGLIPQGCCLGPTGLLLLAPSQFTLEDGCHSIAVGWFTSVQQAHAGQRKLG
jgi:hypothetical protein